jgi:DNA topoisomerase-1
VKHAGINATVPRDLKPDELTLDQAVSLLAERAAKSGSGGGGKKPKTTRAKKTAPVPANDAGDDKPKATKKKAAPKRKAAKKADAPPRTGTDG